MEHELFNFNEQNIDESIKEIYTTFNNKLLILLNVEKYDGPITMQYLPFGGIQSFYNGNLIINCKNCFISVSELIYENNKISSKDFIKKYEDELINNVFPN